MCATPTASARHPGVRPIVTVVAPGLLHVAWPELGLVMHVWRGRADVTLGGVLVRTVAVGRA